MQGLDWQTLQLPFVAVLMQKADDRARQPPSLDIALDCQFDELGGIQTRLPFAALTGALADARRIVEFGNELVAFTKDSIQTRFTDQVTWTQRAVYLAAKVTEKAKYVTTGDQINCDTARLSGIVVHTWVEGTNIYIAISDETTGAVILPPAAVAGTRPRLVALSTKILIFWRDAAGKLVVSPIDPVADPADVPGEMAAPTTVIAAAEFNLFYDVTRLLTTDTAVLAARRVTTTSYTLATITAGAVVATSTIARTCDAAIAVSSTPSGTQVQVVRTDSVSVLGDFITIAAFADVTTAQAIGTSTNTIEAVTAAHRSVANGGAFRCYVFWSGDTGGPVKETRVNYVDTAGGIGTAAQMAATVTLASRAFDHDGSVYVNVVFAESSSFTGGAYAQLQNTYFLYRDSSLLVAKMAAARAGGNADAGDPLPGVQLTSGTTIYTWCGVERRIVPLGLANTAYSDRGPRDITLEFDSNDARRTAQLGNTLYIAGGEILQYDGRQVCEVGFHLYPYSFTGTETAGGSIATNGTYSYKLTSRWDNATGERERSTTATIFSIVLASAPGGVTFAASSTLPVTHKTTPPVGAEYWRTTINPTEDAPFYLVSGTDPDVTANPNGYVANAPTNDTLATFNDELSDVAIASLETNPENGAVLESLAPPAASIIIANDTRLFLGNVAGDPNRVWYSRQRGEGEVASFHDGLTCDVPFSGGDMTALAFLNDTLVVFRETAIYALQGDGLDNLGQGQNFGPARIVSVDCGAVNHESVALTDRGLIFKSSKGWYLLNKGWSLEYIGAPVSDYDSEAITAVHVLGTRHQVRVLSSSRMLVLDTLVNQWSEWTIASGVHAAIWQGTYAYLTTTAVLTEQTTYTSLTYGLDVETAWIKPADLQGWSRCRKILVLGEYRSAHALRIRIAYNYDAAYIDDKSETASPTTVGGPLQRKHGPKRQQIEAIKIRLTAVSVASDAVPPTGEALKLTGIGLEVGAKPGFFRKLPAAQRQ